MEFQQQQQQMAAATGSWVRGSAIGAGSFGTVSLAVSRVDGSLFAVKSIEVGPQHNGELQALENEIDILQSLSSPHVVRCLGGDWSLEMGNHAMRNAFLEYMPGGSVADLMAKFGGRLDESLVRVYTRGILQGLSFLHDNGIVHCDIKGKNLLVGSTGLKLADFGSAKRIKGGDDDRIAAMKGTPLWMAPEVVRQEEQGPASDIWSLGCTVVEMLTGKAPWGDAASAFVALYRIGCSDEVPEMPAFLSSQGKDFLARCLNRDPSKRPTANELLQHPFVTETGHEQAAAEAEPLSPRSPLDFSKWQEESSSSSCCCSPQLPTLALKQKKLDLGDSQGAESTTTSGSCSPKWIVVRSPQGRSQAQKAFDLLSDFDAVAADASSSSSFPSSVNEIDEKDCNASDEQIVASSTDSFDSMATEDEIIVVCDSCSPSGQSGLVSEPELASHPLFLGCAFLHSIHQSSSQVARFLEEFRARRCTDFRSSHRMPRAKIKRKLKRILLLLHTSRFKQIRRLSLLCSINSHLGGEYSPGYAMPVVKPELREWPHFKKICSLSLSLSCGNGFALFFVVILAFGSACVAAVVGCHVHVCSCCVHCIFVLVIGLSLMVVLIRSNLICGTLGLLAVQFCGKILVGICNTPRRGSRSPYGEASMTWTGHEMNPEHLFLRELLFKPPTPNPTNYKAPCPADTPNPSFNTP